MKNAQTIPVEVVGIEAVTPFIKHFTLAALDRAPLPAFSGGSHVIVVMQTPARTHRNPYSLLGSPMQLNQYEIGVRRLDESRGGSHFMHDQVRIGAKLEIAHPVNLFALDKIARKHLLIAGGVGITPFLSQIEDLHHGTAPFEIHYTVRSRQHAAFISRLRSRAGSSLKMYHTGEGDALNVEKLLSHQPLGTHVYACGPAGLIDRVVVTAKHLGWPDSHIHWERFAAPPTGVAFDVFLARSRITVHVPPDRSLLESVEAAQIDVPYLCRGGVCGFCRTRVLEVDGMLVHNDHFLSDAEKSDGRNIMPCVSRAKCQKLVLDL